MRQTRHSARSSFTSTLASWLGVLALLIPIMLPLAHAAAAAPGGLDDGFGALCQPSLGAGASDHQAPSGPQPSKRHAPIGCPICQSPQTLGGFVPPVFMVVAPTRTVVGVLAGPMAVDAVSTVWITESARPRAPPVLT